MKLLVLILCSALSALSFSDALNELSVKLSLQDNLTGEFTQITSDFENTIIAESSGIFTISQPDKLRWETLKPWPQLLVINGRTTWLYDPDFEQATYSQLDESLSASPALLLSGDSLALRNTFTAVLNNGTYELTPLDENSSYSHLRVRFSDDLIEMIEFVDLSSQTTKILLSNTKISEVADDTFFEFSPPEGVEVIFSE